MDADKHPTIIMPLLHPRLNAYILCGPRSGSTLLMNILAVHPAIRALSTSWLSTNNWRKIEHVSRHLRYVVRKYWTKNPLSENPDLKLRMKLRLRLPGRVLLLKDHTNILNAPRLFRDAPDRHRYILLVRNPLSNVSSQLGRLRPSSSQIFIDGQSQMRQLHQLLERYSGVLECAGYRITPDTLPAIEPHIRAAILYHFQLVALMDLREAHPETSLVVHYENLITAPESTLRTIMEFLELPFHPDLLRHTLYYQDDVGHGGIQLKRSIDTSSLTKWRNTLSDAQAAEISRICGSIYAQFNPPV